MDDIFSLTPQDLEAIRKLRSFHNGSYAKLIDKLLDYAKFEYIRGRKDGILECTERLKNLNDSFAKEKVNDSQ